MITKLNAYERQIVKELKDLTGGENISTSRASSKKLDDMKIDVNDEDGILEYYTSVQHRNIKILSKSVI